MATSYYDFSVPLLTHALENLGAQLDKANAHAERKKADFTNFANARLIADMLPFTAQVQIACDTAKGAVARLAAVEAPKHEDNEKTYAELKARIGKTLDFIKSVPADKFVGAETREVVLKFPSVTLTFNGRDYLSKFVLPNFYFHASMAYALLRANGVELGKSDFLGAIQ